MKLVSGVKGAIWSVLRAYWGSFAPFVALTPQRDEQFRTRQTLRQLSHHRLATVASIGQNLRRLYRQRRDALVAALERQLGDIATVYGGSAGMHLALRLHDGTTDDVQLSTQLLGLGIMAPALSLHAVGTRVQPWRGFLLGDAQVPAEAMEPLVQTLAAVIHRITPAGIRGSGSGPENAARVRTDWSRRAGVSRMGRLQDLGVWRIQRHGASGLVVQPTAHHGTQGAKPDQPRGCNARSTRRHQLDSWRRKYFSNFWPTPTLRMAWAGNG